MGCKVNGGLGRLVIVSAMGVAFGLQMAEAARQFEYLDRGVVAVRQSNTAALVTWRSLADDEADLGFNVYRVTGKDTVKVNAEVLTKGTNFADASADFSKENKYFVKKVLNGRELPTVGSYTMPANKGVGPYVTVPIQAGSRVHFVWVGDLDGDGAYDYVLDRPSDDEQKLEAYSGKGKHLWTVNMGPNSANKNNISPGASTLDVGMWDGATVYDIDSDGYAELIVRIADGVVFGDGKKYSNSTTNGQAIAVLDGRTGSLKYSAETPKDYINVGPLACMMEIGYLDGKTPSIICWFKNRNANKSFNSLMVAYKVQNGKLVQQWKYDNKNGYAEAHQIRVADVDLDGKDEVLHMGYALNGDGSLRYHIDEVVHGDRWYVGAFNKGDKVMMGYGIQQDHPKNLLEYYYNASTGKIVWTHYGDESCAGQCDMARGNVGDIDPNYDGFEVWSFQGTYNGASNKKVADNYLYPVIRYWWDGDLASESYNDGKIEKWHYEDKTVWRLATTWKVYASSGSERGAAMFHGDILGDWREESILVNYETNELVIFTTDIESDYRFYSLAQNPCYRNGMTAKGYVQAHMLDYFLGFGMDAPKKPDIEIIGGSREDSFANYPIDEAPNKCGEEECSDKVQGENFLTADGVKENMNIGFEAEGYLNLNNELGSKATYMVYTEEALTQVFYFRFANGGGAGRDMTVNGEKIEFPATTNWKAWNVASVELKLEKGYTTIELKSLTENGGPNIDWIGVTGGLVNFVSEIDSGKIATKADSGDVADSTKNTTGLFAPNAPRGWHVVRGAEGIVLNAGAQSLTARLFDMNGKLLSAKRLQQGASWVIPATGVPALLQIKNGSRTETMRLGL